MPAFRSTFHLTAAAAGLVLSGHFAGSVLGVLSPNGLPQRMRTSRFMAMGGTCLFGLGCLIIGLAPLFPMAIAGAAVEGTGWGLLVIVFNTLFASGFAGRSAAMLTLLNATYGLGAILAPAGVGLFSSTNFRPPFVTIAALALVLLPLAWALSNTPDRSGSEGESERVSVAGVPWVLAGYMAAFFLYGGLEGGIAAWEPTHLVATGLSVSHAATITALFWTTFTAGRLLAASLSLRFPPSRIVPASLAVVALSLGLTRFTPITAAAYTVSGLMLAPVFPLALIWVGRSLALSSRTTSLIIAADLFGGVVLSAALGRLITASSAASLPFAFSAMALGELCILLGLQVGVRGLLHPA